MGRFDYYKHGDWNAICDVCGRKWKGSMLRERWDGLMVCPDDFEMRQPQEYVRGVVDNQNPPFNRPEATDSFAAFCSLEGQWSVAGYSVAGCWVSGRTISGV